jgi:hypothetical protein
MTDTSPSASLMPISLVCPSVTCRQLTPSSEAVQAVGAPQPIGTTNTPLVYATALVAQGP